METAAEAAAKKEGNTHSHFMPNKTNNCPTLERSRVGAAEVLGALTEVTAMGMRCPHADMHEMLHMADATLRAIRSTSLYMHPYLFVLPEMTIDRDNMLAAATSGWSAATELGNRMVLDHGLDYRTAHHILNNFINVSKKSGRAATDAHLDDLEAAATKVIGKPLGMSQETLRKSLDPKEFVQVTGSRGGVAVPEAQRMLAVRQQNMRENRERHTGRVSQLEQAKALLISDLHAFCT
jgi:argininosuccinate lyase